MIIKTMFGYTTFSYSLKRYFDILPNAMNSWNKIKFLGPLISTQLFEKLCDNGQQQNVKKEENNDDNDDGEEKEMWQRMQYNKQ